MKKEKDRKTFVSLHEQGLSLREIGKATNSSPNTVKKYLLLAGRKVNVQNKIYHLKSHNQFLQGVYCGLWAGDGTQYYDKGYTVKICLHSENKELVHFVQDIIFKLFGKTSRFTHDHGNFSGFVIFSSKFIFDFVKNHLAHEEYKTLTVRLKKSAKKYSREFLDGFLLGLMLSDGYLKRYFSYNTISEGLVSNVQDILSMLSFESKVYIHRRARYGWNDLFMIKLRKKESLEVEKLLDSWLKRVDYNKGFAYLKG